MIAKRQLGRNGRGRSGRETSAKKASKRSESARSAVSRGTRASPGASELVVSVTLTVPLIQVVVAGLVVDGCELS